jgi:autotransporter-associated beta strand protein
LFNSGALQINGVRYISLGSNATIGSNGGRFDLGRDHTGTVNQCNGHVLTKVGSNTVAILNTSTGLSGVVINGGVLTAETDAALGTAPITINGGALGSWGERTLSNTVTLAGAGGVDVQGGNLTLSGVVDGAGNLSKTGGNILTLTGNNTQTGTLYVSGGHVQFASGTGNATQGNVEMLNPGSFLLMAAPNQFGANSGLLFNSSGGHNEFALYGNNQTIASLASTNGFAVVQNSHGGFGAASASSTLTVNQSTDTAYYGVFRDSTGSDAFTLGLVKEGAGKLTMATNTSHTGGTTVNDGVLEIAGSSGGNGYLRGTATVNAGGELRYTGGDGTGFGYNGGNKIDTLNINGGLVDSTNTAHLYGVNVNMTGGELRVSAGTIMWNYVTVNTAASASTALINGSITLRADNGFSNSIFTVADGAAATDLQVSSPISELYGAIGLTKNGAGTMLLTGANSYTGATTISGGKLLINGDNSGATGAVNVASGATLGGSGTVGGATTIQSGGHLAVGNSPGTQTFSSNLTFDSGSIFDWDLAGNVSSSTGTRGTDYDGVDVTGNLTIASDAIFRVIQNSGLDFNDNFWDSTQTWSDIFNVTGTPTLNWSNAAVAVYDTSNVLQDVSSYGSFTITGGTLTWTAVPEPTSALAGLLLTAGLLRRRR